MDIAGMLAQSGALDSAAREMGIDPRVAATGASALLPAILGGFKQQATSGGGVEGLASILGGLGGGGLLDAVTGGGATEVERGNDVLGQIFGSKDVSRQVASHASAQSGVDANTLKKLLPIVTMLVGGYLASQRGGTAQAAPAGGGGMGGMLGQVLGSVLGGGSRAAAPAAAPASGGLGGIASMLDLDGDGNPLNDIIGMAGKLRR